MADNRLPLKGIRIADFTWVYAGPYGGMLLGILGAEVIKIEGHIRTDLTRHSFAWPHQDDEPRPTPPNQGAAFNVLNMNKKSVTLDLSKPEGREIVRKIIAVSDVVLDNFRAGAMQRMGLGYEELCKIKPDIIALSCSSRGQTGPQRDYGGYAAIHHAIGGGAHLTGYPDGEPSNSTIDIDLTNSTLTAFLILAALHHHSRTGEGQFIDLSQIETVSAIIGEQFLAYQMTGEVPGRHGNFHPRYAPHNVYRCWGVDKWIALEVHTDQEFAALAGVIGQPELARDPRFATMAARKENEADLDKIIEEWTSKRDRNWMVKELNEAGVAAAPSRDAKDIYADPHLKARNAFVTIDHPEVGPMRLPGAFWKTSEGEPEVVRAPLLGEHNDYVLRGLLGMGYAEISALREKKVIM